MIVTSTTPTRVAASLASLEVRMTDHTAYPSDELYVYMETRQGFKFPEKCGRVRFWSLSLHATGHSLINLTRCHNNGSVGLQR